LLVRCARETGALVTAEEHSILGGLGGAVAEVIAENAPVPLVRVGLKDVFGESGSPDELLAKYGLTAEEIAKAARVAVGRKK
jgi:transketolase